MNEKQVGYFVLLIKDKIGKQYWLVVEMKDTASLRDLDQFLRDIWLECCGHLSGFDIEGERYESSSQISDGWARQKRRRSISCLETTRLLMFVKYAKRKQPQLFAWSVSMTEQGCFVTIVKKIMSVSRKCFQTYIIHPGLVSVDMKEA